MCQLAMNFLSGGPLQVLIELISLTISTGTKFKTKLRKLRVTLKCFEPLIIEQIRLRNIELSLPVDHIEELQRRIEEGTALVAQISNLRNWSMHIWLNCCNCIKPDYAGQLDELDDSFQSILGRLRVRAVLQSDELVILARQTRDKEDENRRELAKIWDRLSSLSENHQERSERNENDGNAPTSGERGGGGGTPTQVLHLSSVFLRLHEAITLMKVKKHKFKCVLEDFKFTMDCLKPLITEIAQPNSLLHLPKEGVENFIMQLEKGVELVYKYSSYKKSGYIKGLSGLNDDCQRMFDTLRLQIEEVVIQSSVSASNLWKEIKEIEGTEVLQHQFEVSEAEPQSPTLGLDVNTLNSDVAVNQIQFGVAKPLSLVIESDVMNIYENWDLARNVDDEVEEIGGINGTINRIEFRVADPAVSHTDVLHTKNMYKNLDPAARDVKEGVEEVQRNRVTQNQIKVLVAEPLSDAMNTCENLDPAARNVKEEVEEVQGNGVAQNQIEVLVAEPLSDAMNTCENLDLAARNVKEEVEEVQGNRVAQNESEVLVDEPLSDAMNACENLDRAKDTKVVAKEIEEKGKQISHGVTRKVVLKLDLHEKRDKNKAMKAVVGLEGVESVALDVKDQKMTVTGHMDPVSLVSKLRKLCRTEIVSVGVKEEKKKEEPKKGDESKKKEDPNDEHLKFYNQHYSAGDPSDLYFLAEDPNGCAIC